MQILRTDWRGDGKWGAVARALNALGRLFNDMVGENGIEVEYRGGRVVISGSGGGGGSGFPWDKLAFGYALAVTEAGAHECTIHPGAVRLHGIGNLSLAEDAKVTLTGDPEWVFVEYARSMSSPGGAVTIGHSATEPESTSATVRVPLYRFDARADGGYTLGMICHLGDVQFDSPIR